MKENNLAPIDTIDKSLSGVRMMSTLLLDVAATYRSKHFLEDIKINKLIKESSLKKEKLSRQAYRTKLRDIAKDSQKEYEADVALNNKIKSIVSDVVHSLDEAGKKSFEEKSAFITIVASQALDITNYSDVLLLIEMYNQGAFKDMFDNIKANQENSEKKESEETPVIKMDTDNDNSIRDELSKL